MEIVVIPVSTPTPTQTISEELLASASHYDFEREITTNTDIPLLGDMIVGIDAPCEYEICSGKYLIKHKWRTFEPIIPQPSRTYTIKSDTSTTAKIKYRHYPSLSTAIKACPTPLPDWYSCRATHEYKDNGIIVTCLDNE